MTPISLRFAQDDHGLSAMGGGEFRFETSWKKVIKGESFANLVSSTAL
jgi:hypothetical protein